MTRIRSVDTFRFLAIIGVVALHAPPFEGQSGAYQYLDALINQGARFAVPFFFVISGYFFSNKLHDRDLVVHKTKRVVKRLFLLWLFWSCVYILPYDIFSAFEYGMLGPVKVVYWNILNIANNPWQFLFEGSKVHLWFLMGLIWSILIVAASYRWLSRPLKPLIAFAVALYVFGLCAAAYSATPIGIHIDFNTRNGPFFGTIFFVMGLMLSKYRFEPRHLAYGFLILMAGYLVHFGEIYYLYSTYDVWPTEPDYVVGTLLLGLGAAIIALSNHPLLAVNGLSTIGKYTLGIYAVHFVFVDILRSGDNGINNPLWGIGCVVIVLALSVGITLLATRSEKLKMFFS